MSFPIAKLGFLLLKQISKPIAKSVKERAKRSPFFRTYICMPPAHFYNWCEVKTKMWILDLGKPSVVPTLNEAMAIELGANLLGESLVFLVAVGIVYMEYMRGVRKEHAKEAAGKVDMDTLHYTIQELYFTTEKQDAQIRELNRIVADLETRVSRKPRIFATPNPTDLSYDPVSAIGSNEFDDHSKHNHPIRKNGIVLQAVEDVKNDIIHKRQ